MQLQAADHKADERHMAAIAEGDAEPLACATHHPSADWLGVPCDQACPAIYAAFCTGA